jgi:transketolase
MTTGIELKSINTIRTLSIDAIEKANSGHPGMPMGAAPMAYTLWTEFMKHNPKNSKWFNRDRFVLSAGHGSMLLYSLLHLSGYNVTMDDIKNFRQWGSKTPGHPEFGHTDGVEATTGPLGQGFAMAVGMAMAEAHLGAKYNRENFPVVDHYTFSICGDGDLMEGISHEAASLAGHLKLGKLIVLYDSNDISLDGDLHKSFSENVENRFKSYGWQVIRVEDGNNLDELRKALQEAKSNIDAPTLIEVKTVIGYGSPNKSGKSASHGSPLGAEEVKLTKGHYQWEHEDFHVPEEVYDDFKQKVIENGQAEEEKWNALFQEYKKTYPELGKELELAITDELPEGWYSEFPEYKVGEDKPATRETSGKTLNAIAKKVPYFWGGSADLAGSNKTTINGEEDFSRNQYSGRNIWFGVREFAMAAALNGMLLHGGVRAYAGTFFVFSDYLRPAVRLAALMNIPSIFVLTHDSIAVGEDGPTHEPIEHLASFRAMPNVSVMRPADGYETNAAWRLAMESKDTPSLLVLTRQGLPTLEGTKENAYEGVKRGAYIVSKEEKDSPDAILIATGSEVHLAIEAQKVLKEKGKDVRVVSMPSWDRFEKQPQEYKDSILPKNVKKRVAIEMGSTLGWDRYVGDEGIIIGIDKFGASAPGGTIMKEYGFTVEHVVNKVESLF